MFISFGELNIKSLLFILVPFFVGLRWLLESNFKNENNNLFFRAFLRFLARSLSVFFWIFLSRNMSFSKNKENENKLNNKLLEKDEEEIAKEINNECQESISPVGNDDDISNISLYEIEKRKRLNKEKQFNDIKKRIKIKSTILLFLTGFLDFCCVFVSHILYELDLYKEFSGGIVILSANIRLFAFSLFSHFLIKLKKTQKHQFYSMMIIAFIVFIFLISSIIFESEKNNEFFTKFLVMIIPELGFSCVYSLGLLYLIKSKGNIYKLLFFNGMLGIILSIIIQAIFSNFNCHQSDAFIHDFNYCKDNGEYRTILSNFESFKNFGGFLSIGIILTNCIENIFIYLLVYYFSLNHFGALFAMPTYIRFITDDYSIFLRLYYIVGGIIIVFMTLVFTEIIILRFWGLDSNTKEEIIKRAQLEYNMDIKLDINDNKEIEKVKERKSEEAETSL